MEKMSLYRRLSSRGAVPAPSLPALVVVCEQTQGVGTSPTFLGGAEQTRCISPENLRNGILVIGSLAWGFFWGMEASPVDYAGRESRGIQAMPEPVGGGISTGTPAMFTGRFLSSVPGRALAFMGLGLPWVCTPSGFPMAPKRATDIPRNISPLCGSRTGQASAWNWRPGFFHVNNHDPRVILPSTRGVGRKLSLAHPRAWDILLGGMVLPALLPVAWLFGGAL